MEGDNIIDNNYSSPIQPITDDDSNNEGYTLPIGGHIDPIIINTETSYADVIGDPSYIPTPSTLKPMGDFPVVTTYDIKHDEEWLDEIIDDHEGRLLTIEQEINNISENNSTNENNTDNSSAINLIKESFILNELNLITYIQDSDYIEIYRIDPTHEAFKDKGDFTNPANINTILQYLRKLYYYCSYNLPFEIDHNTLSEILFKKHSLNKINPEGYDEGEIIQINNSQQILLIELNRDNPKDTKFYLTKINIEIYTKTKTYYYIDDNNETIEYATEVKYIIRQSITFDNKTYYKDITKNIDYNLSYYQLQTTATQNITESQTYNSYNEMRTAYENEN